MPETLDAHEVERKYELPSGRDMPELAGLPGVATASEPDELSLEATYFDTVDLRLARRGVTLRRRTGGDDEGWHLKLPADRDTREEVHAPLGRGTRTVPAALADLVRAYTRGARLVPVARIATERRRRRLLDDAGQVLAEVVADEVDAQTLGESTTLSSWSELEVELAGGGPELLDAVEERLRDAGISRAQASAKLTRLLADRLDTSTHAEAAPSAEPRGKAGGKARAKAKARTAAAGDVVVAYLRQQVETVLAYDPKVRRDEPDSVHKMRVATRRLRSALRTYRSIVDPQATAKLGAELRWLAGVLGAVRDREVLQARLEGEVAGLPPELAAGPVAARVTGRLAGELAEAREHLLSAMRSRRYYALLDALDDLLTAPPLTPLAAQPARKVLPRLVAKDWRRLDRRLTAAERRPAGATRDEAIHAARKAAKRARYAAELATPAFGKDARRFARRMEDLQELLGAHQDSVVARPALRELGMQAHLAGENAFTFGLLYAAEQNRAATTEADLPAVRRRASRKKHRRWLQ